MTDAQARTENPPQDGVSSDLFDSLDLAAAVELISEEIAKPEVKLKLSDDVDQLSFAIFDVDEAFFSIACSLSEVLAKATGGDAQSAIPARSNYVADVKSLVDQWNGYIKVCTTSHFVQYVK